MSNTLRSAAPRRLAPKEGRKEGSRPQPELGIDPRAELRETIFVSYATYRAGDVAIAE